MKTKLLILFIIATILTSCRQREQNLDTLMDDLIKKGYTGQFERPSGKFEKAALGLFGVDDYMAFKSAENSFVVVSFKSEDAVISEERIESLMKMMENKFSEEDINHHITRENWREYVYQNKNFVVAWEYEIPTEVIEIVGKY